MASLMLFPIAVACFVSCLLSFSRATTKCTLSNPQPISLSLSNCTVHHIDGRDVDSWGVSLSLSGQELCFVPSTVVNNTLVMGAEVCSNDHNGTLAQCTSRRGGLFDIAAAGSSFVNISLADLAADTGWREIMKPLPPFTVAGKTTLQLPADISVPMSIAVITQGQNHTAGHLGLGLGSVFLRNLVSQGLATAPAFGINAGSQSHSNPRDGSLVLGGYDKASVNGHFINYTMEYPVIQRTESRICPLQVTIEKLIFRSASGADVELISVSQPTPACIEL